MKMVLAIALAAGALLVSTAGEAAERHSAHRHGASAHVSKHVTRHAAHRHRAHRHVVTSPCCRRDRTADRRANAPIRGPFAVESMDDGRAAPTINNDYWFQESIYDVQAGKRGNIKEYRY